MKSMVRIGLAVGALLLGQAASAVPLTFNFDTGSNVFRPRTCNVQSDLDLNRNGSLDTLRLCGPGYPVTGFISGNWDGSRLTGLSGNIDGSPILGGSLGGQFYTSANFEPLWRIVTLRWGTLIFERLDGVLNQISENGLQLIGQNLAAYGVAERRCVREGQTGFSTCGIKGVEIFSGSRLAVSEPGTLLVLALGLAGTVLVLRRRQPLAARAA